ncbi:NAD(P)/FAD-dependent oxidoreductase [Micromonospora carbonacea]|uniref:Dehydrogenase (Flavoprotein) n=1 Tax=Micromonospora carbonacea TaxID=47853 RepID=A0A1C4ZNC1_9ACTN|nr:MULTISPECIES: NAD(P)/FAD-dependent oxidoreductase [Micromonospora]MDG4819256.1 NAD(P)/FAD-dependent oxidoreductase [Micromonospora sp. WMMD956]SCF34493.1 Dehydrogenase (flavoprotein) [Micromonospora carbonacea]
MFDVIVVGARCAGSPVAMLLARRGHRVLMVDRSSFPSDAVSTHYIHQSGLARLQAWGLLDEVIDAKTPAIRKMNYANHGIPLVGFADPIDGIDAVYCPRRIVLDEILVNAARRAGVEVLEQFTVSDLVFADGRVVGIRGREGDGPDREFRASVVVGADGFHSTVARKVGAELYNVRPAAGFTYYSYYSGLDWGLHHKTGFHEQWYGTWPTNDDLNMVAVICTRRQLKEFRQDPEARFLAVLDDVEPEMAQQLRDQGRREEPLRPMRYPDNYYRQSHGPGWALVGDAGYHKDPITGWGMTDAFLHGELLADRIHEGLSGARTMDDALADYVKVRDEETAPVYDYTTSVAELTLTPYLETVLGAISTSQEWTTKMLGIIAGGVEGYEIFAPDNLDRLYDDAGVPQHKRIYEPS